MYKKIPPSLCDNYTKKLFLETGENWVTLRFAPSCWNYIISIRSLFRRVRYIYLYNLYIIWMYAAVQKSSHTSTHTYSHHPFHSWSVFVVFVFGLAHSFSRPFPLPLPLPHSLSLSSLVFFPFCFTQSLSLLRFSFVLFLFACVIARKIKVAYCCKRTDCKRDHWKPATFNHCFKYISVYTIRYSYTHYFYNKHGIDNESTLKSIAQNPCDAPIHFAQSLYNIPNDERYSIDDISAFLLATLSLHFP